MSIAPVAEFILIGLNPLTPIVLITSNLKAGLVVPIPILAPLSYTMLSVNSDELFHLGI